GRGVRRGLGCFGPGGLNTWSRRAFAQGRQGVALAPAEVALWLRLATIVAALGCAFLLDDPREPTTEGVAGSLLLRRGLGGARLRPARAAGGVAVRGRARPAHPARPLPVAALTLEAAAVLAVAVALAAAGARLTPERRGGVVAAPALLALACAAFLLPARVALYPPPGRAAWDAAHRRWAVLLGLALAAFATACRDPARRRLPSHLRRLARSLRRDRKARAAGTGDQARPLHLHRRPPA